MNKISNDLKACFPALNYFKWDHLPEKLQDISKPFAELALKVALDCKKGDANSDWQEASQCIRKLLEAKDCAVRSVGNFK